jgi:hypothetical protein
MSPTASMGSSSSTTNSQQHAEKSPWGPTIEPLERIIGLLGGQIDNYKPTANENRAFNQLERSAERGNPYTGQIGQFARQMLNGGLAGARMLTNHGKRGYEDLERRLSPYADGEHIGPDGNPQLKPYLDVLRADITNQVNPMFAAAGRDFSGQNMDELGRGITKGLAPVLAAQYNTDVGRQFDAANSIHGANNWLSQFLSSVEDRKIANKTAGIGIGNAHLAARDWGPNQMLEVEGARRGLPINNLGLLTKILGPIAQLGGTVDTSGTSSTNGSSSSFGFGAPAGK